MLSYADIGPAAMMSARLRAWWQAASSSRSRIGSRRSPRHGAAGHSRDWTSCPAGAAIKVLGSCSGFNATIQFTISIDEARRRLAAAVRPISAPSASPRRVVWPRRRGGRRVDNRRAAIRPLRHGRIRRSRIRHHGRDASQPRPPAPARSDLYRRGIGRRLRRHLRRNRDGRTAAVRRRRRGDGRTDRDGRSSCLDSGGRRSRSAHRPPRRGHRRRRPGDAPGDVLTPSRIGALAAVGAPTSRYARPRVAVLSTGNEVVDPGQPLPRDTSTTSNRFTLGAIVSMHGGMSEPHRAAEDTLHALVDALDACAGATSSCFQAAAPSASGSHRRRDCPSRRDDLSRHRSQAGKPTAFALVAGTPFFGCPATRRPVCRTPTSCFVPFLRALARLPANAPHHQRSARSTHRIERRASPVLHGAARRRHRVSRPQRLWRHHQPLKGRRIHRDSGRGKRGRSRRGRGHHVLLI